MNPILQRVPQALRRGFQQLVGKFSLKRLASEAEHESEAVPQPFPAAHIYVNTSLRALQPTALLQKQSNEPSLYLFASGGQAAKSQAWLFSFWNTQ